MRIIADIVQAVKNDASLNPSVREAALRQLQRVKDGPERWNRLAWGVVEHDGGPHDQVLDAVRMAEAACRDKLDANHLNTLGVARYRAADYQGALDALQRSDSIAVKESGEGLIWNRPFLAMAHHRLGQHDQAVVELSEFRRRLPLSTDRRLADALADAEALIEGKQRAESRPN